jgi:hypothetical protein
LAQGRIPFVLEADLQGQEARREKEVQELIFGMVVENSTWGAPRIHGELLMLGFDVSERTIFRWMKRAPRDPEPARRGLTFLRKRREAIAAMDFFTVPTITFSALYCFFVVSHDRRPPALQYHKASDKLVDRAAVARGISIWIRSNVRHL